MTLKKMRKAKKKNEKCSFCRFSYQTSRVVLQCKIASKKPPLSYEKGGEKGVPNAIKLKCLKGKNGVILFF